MTTPDPLDGLPWCSSCRGPLTGTRVGTGACPCLHECDSCGWSRYEPEFLTLRTAPWTAPAVALIEAAVAREREAAHARRHMVEISLDDADFIGTRGGANWLQAKDAIRCAIAKARSLQAQIDDMTGASAPKETT